MRVDLSTPIFDVQIMAFENRGAITSAEQTSSRGYEWQNLLRFDGGWDIPNRIENYLLHLLGEDRRLFVWLAHHDTRRVDNLAIVHYAQHELRHVDVDVIRPKVIGKPTPALHVYQNRADFAVIGAGVLTTAIGAPQFD